MVEPALSLSGVSQIFDSKTIISGIDFHLEPGEKVGLLGPTGAGKTTLLNICAGLVAPAAGQIHLFGKSPANLSRIKKSQLVGLMHQHYDLVDSLQVRHNIQAGFLGSWGFFKSLAALLLPLESPTANDVAERVAISSLLSKRTDLLSGGEKQRVALARLLIQDPLIFLADEPVASVDPARAEDLLTLLVQKPECTVLASLHNPKLAFQYMDRILGLRSGRLLFDLPVSQVGEPELAELYEI